MSGDRIGELLVRQKLISLQQLRKAQEEQRREGTSLGYALAKMGFVSDKQITEFLSQQYRVQAVDLREYEIDPEVLKLIPHEICERHRILPVSRAGSSLIVAMADPSNLHAIDDIKFTTGYNVEPVVASETAIMEAIERYYTQESNISYDEIMEGFDENEIEFAEDEGEDMLDLERASEDAPVVRLCNAILLSAIKKGASDIHIEPYEKLLRVRYRVDGVLHDEMHPPLKLKNAIASRFKIMASLDIAERRLPQDGRIKLKLGKGREMDFRVNCLPTIWGEKICMRLLDKSNLQLDMTKLGFETKALEDFKEAIYKPFGMVLVTGPTGSGKTTTLYSTLRYLSGPEINITTVEDPIEMVDARFCQVQVNPQIDVTFANALRTILRQDPDIIMVGEVRDAETAAMAVQAALTGHLVFSTLHTRNASGAITRLVELGVEPFLLSSVLRGVVAQRLIRRICPRCAVEGVLTGDQVAALNIKMPAERRERLMVRWGEGCVDCRNTGLYGRSGVFEMLDVGKRVRGLINQGKDANEIHHAARIEGMESLREAALRKLAEGETAFEEVARVAADVE